MKKIIILLFLVVITSYSVASRAFICQSNLSVSNTECLGPYGSLSASLSACQTYGDTGHGCNYISNATKSNYCGTNYNTVYSPAYYSVDANKAYFVCPGNYQFPNNGTPQDCMNGSTGFFNFISKAWTALTTTPISSAASCIGSMAVGNIDKYLTDLEDFKPLKSGESKVCMNGMTVSFPETCSTRLLLQSLPIAGVGQAGTRIAEMELVPYADDEFKLLMNMESKVTNAAGDTLTGHSQMLQDVPPAAVAQGLSDFLKTPAGIATVGAIVAASAGLLTSDTQGNLYSPYNGTAPLTPNQTLEAAKVFNVPIPQGATQYIPLDYIPQIQTGVDDVNRDFGKMYDGDAATSPTNYTSSNFGPTPFLFNDLLNRPLASPYISGTSPVAPPPHLALAPSPLIPPPDTVPTPTPTPTPNPQPLPNPTTTTTGTSTTTSPSPTGTTTTTTTTTTDLGPVPVQPVTPAGPGNLQDFLNMPNPFTMSLPVWFPTLPEPSCTYEIHTTIFQRPFDLAPCVPLQPLRAVLQWAFSVLTIWVCFKIVFKPNGMSA